MAGTNDLSQGVAPATAVANLRTIWATLRASGIEPIAISLLPRDAPAAYAADVPTWNAAIASAAATDGVRFIDVYTNCHNGSGGFKAGWTYINGVADPTGLHPGNEAAHQMAADIAAAVEPTLAARPRTGLVDSATTCLLTNGTLSTQRPLHSTLGGGLFPSTTGWAARFDQNLTSAVSVVAEAPATSGNALKVVLPAQSGSDGYSDRNGSANHTVTPGARYALMARLQFDAGHAEDSLKLGLQGGTTPGAVLWAMDSINSRCASTLAGASLTARDVYHELTIPPGITSVRPWLELRTKNGSAGSTTRLAHFGLRAL